MQRLKDRTRLPHGGAWFWMDPVTRRPFLSTESFAALVSEIRYLYERCGRPIREDLEDAVDSYMAERMPREFVTGRPIGSEPIKHEDVVVRCNILFQEGAGVDRIVAERRAEVCRHCIENDYGSGVLCEDLRVQLRGIYGKTSADAWLGLCTQNLAPTCGLVFLRQPPTCRYERCWMLKENHE